MDNWRDLSGRLEKCSIAATAPLRLDCGGSTDHPLTALLGKVYHPATTNMALELRTRVSLQPYHSGKILIEFEGQGKKEIDPCELNFAGSYGLMNAIIAHFGVTGFHLSVNFQAPPYSGLGGSGALSVAVIGALLEAISDEHNNSTDLSKISLLAHNIEDALYGNTGLQDQLAAAFGDVHLWEWDYDSSLHFSGSHLNCDSSDLESHILLAYTGEPHPSSEKGSMFLHAFRNGTQKSPLESVARISQVARLFAHSIEVGDYTKAGVALLNEMRIRSTFIPGLLNDTGSRLTEYAVKLGCGAKITGHGGGGCVWAIGPDDSIAELRNVWQVELAKAENGFLLPVSIARNGLQVIYINRVQANVVR